MAIYKQIRMPNGVPCSYHRVLSVKVETNVRNRIEVASYVDAESREQEREYSASLASGSPTGVPPYVAVTLEECPYDPAMTVDAAYEHLKTLDIFSGAEDIPEDCSSDSSGGDK